MLSKLRPRSIYDVMAAIGCFAALATGTAYAANTIRSTDIVDGEVKTADVANQNLTGGDIKDGSISSFDVANLVGDDIADGTLKDEDIGETAARDVRRYVGPVPAHNCIHTNLLGYGPADGDHIVITPFFLDADSRLSYNAEYDTRGYQQGIIQVCNPTDAVVDDDYTTFNMLAINGR